MDLKWVIIRPTEVLGTFFLLFMKVLAARLTEEEGYSLQLVLALSLFYLVLLGFPELWIHLEFGSDALFALAGASLIRAEEILCYLPHFHAFSLENLVPSAPAYDQNLSNLSHFPPLMLIFSGMLFQVTNSISPLVFALCAHALIPLLCFWLLVFIFSRYLKRSFALVLSFFCASYFSGFSVANFYYSILRGDLLIPINPPELTRFPFPSLSLLCFLIPLYLCLKTHRIGLKRTFALSFLFAIQVYLYGYNFLAGSIFFFTWLAYACFLTKRHFDFIFFGKVFGLATTVFTVVAGPYVYFLTNLMSRAHSPGLFFEVPGNIIHLSQWGAILGYALPIILLVSSIVLFKGDWFEVWFRFTFVFIAIFVDVVIGVTHHFLAQPISPELYYHRISNLVFRFFYFVPFLYFIQLPLKSAALEFGNLLSRIRHYLHWFFECTLVRYRIFLCALGIVTVSIPIFLHGYREVQNFSKSYAIHQMALNELAILENENGKIVLSASTLVNLMLPLANKKSSLLINTFSNQISEQVAMERLVLMARILNWSREKFIQFMTPSELHTNFVSYSRKRFQLGETFLNQGLGYWLLYHRKRLKPIELEAYQQMLITQFENADISELIDRHPVERVLLPSNGKLDHLKEYFSFKNLDNFILCSLQDKWKETQ